MFAESAAAAKELRRPDFHQSPNHASVALGLDLPDQYIVFLVHRLGCRLDRLVGNSATYPTGIRSELARFCRSLSEPPHPTHLELFVSPRHWSSRPD